MSTELLKRCGGAFCGDYVDQQATITQLVKQLERIATLKPRPILDPHDCEGRPRRIAREALEKINENP